MTLTATPKSHWAVRPSTGTPYPSSVPASPENILIRPRSFDTSGSDDMLEVPISSSPPSSSPGAVTTPPDTQDARSGSHCLESTGNAMRNATAGSLINVTDLNDDFFDGKQNPSDSNPVVSLLSDLEPVKALNLPEPRSSACNIDEDDYSSGSESWIEDYMDSEPQPPHSVKTTQLEFSKQLEAKIDGVLHHRMRIQPPSPTTNVSPYTQDLLTRSGGIPSRYLPHQAAVLKTDAQVSPGSTSRSSTSSAAVSIYLDGTYTSTSEEIDPSSPMSFAIVPKSARVASIANNTGNSDSSDENEAEVVFPGAPVLHPSLSLALDPAYTHERPFHTPDLGNSVTTPSAPKKDLHHVHPPRPRSEPPRLDLSALICSNPAPSRPRDVDPVDLSTAKHLNVDNTIKASGAYTQVSGSKRTVPEPTENPDSKKRKLAIRRTCSKAENTLAQREKSQRDVLSTLLNPGKFAARCASLRKAASLRSEPSHEEISSPEVYIKEGPSTKSSLGTPHLSPVRESHYFSHGVTITPSLVYPPTQPATPMPLTLRAKFQAQLKDQTGALDSVPYSVPILAPPPYTDIPRAPANEVDAAEARIALMLAKEREERKGDGLLNPFLGEIAAGVKKQVREDTPAEEADELEEGEDMDDEEKQLWRDAGWDSDELFPERKVAGVSETEMDCDKEDEDAFEWPLQLKMSIAEDFRQEAVEWILDALPSSLSSKSPVCKHLHEQLSHSSDTRWHAAQLFIRYLAVSSEDERAAVIWDTALACLSLSVKFHRDVLGPFFPVLADEFLTLAPHQIEYDDFEAAQRDILAGFSHCIGSVTPGAYMQELWQALPSLQALLSFKGGLEAARRAAWEILYDTLFELSYLKFPTSLLTACAFVHGIVDTLILQARVDSATHLQSRTERWRSRRGARCDCIQMRKAAQNKVKDVELDIRDVLGVKTEDWEGCWRWLEMLLEGR